MNTYSHTAGDRTPYTYCLTHLPSGKRYYGVKWSRGCHPSTFWTEYQTSSEYVKSLIEQDGEEAFTFEIRMVFDDAKKALRWEKEVLKRLRVPLNPNWLNRRVPDERFYATPESSAKQAAKMKGRPKPESQRAKMRKPKSEETKAKMRKPKSEEAKKNIALGAVGKKMSPEALAKREATRKANGPRKPHSEETRRKMSEAHQKRKR